MTVAEVPRPTVYLIAQPTVSRRRPPLNLEPLYAHGEVQVVLPMSDSPTFTPVTCYEVMEDRLSRFNPEVDYLVWAGGDTLAAVMAGMILVNQEEPIWRFNWLRYERHRNADGSRTDKGAKYVPVVIDLRDPQYDLLESENDRATA
jgi:hypothetical protein